MLLVDEDAPVGLVTVAFRTLYKCTYLLTQLLTVRAYQSLEYAATGDHVAAVTGGIQECTEDETVPQIIRQRKLLAGHSSVDISVIRDTQRP